MRPSSSDWLFHCCTETPILEKNVKIEELFRFFCITLRICDHLFLKSGKNILIMNT